MPETTEKRQKKKRNPRRDTKNDEGTLRRWRSPKRDGAKVGKGVNEGHKGQRGFVREEATRTAAEPVGGLPTPS